MRDRVMGIENEFGVMLEKDGAFSPITENETRALKGFLRDGVIKGSFASIVHERLWLPNGSLLYVDIGLHPEFASCECRRVRDLVRYSKAGEIIAALVFGGLMPDGRRPLLFKNNLGYAPSTYSPTGAFFRTAACDSDLSTMGCHENYLVFGLPIYDDTLFDNLAPFLITRQIFDGAGWWTDKGSFLYSQRARMIEVERRSLYAPTKKPIVDTKKELLVGEELKEKMRRLHLILGDANMLEAATFLKFGTTSLVLSLIEEGLLSLPKCVNTLETLRGITHDTGCDMPLLYFEDGSSMSPLETQIWYLKRVRQYIQHTTFESEQSEQEAKEIAVFWEQALNAIEHNDTEWMLGRLDWATKRYIGEEAVKQKGATGQDAHRIRKTVDILYHAISDPRMQQRLNARWPSRRLLTDREIEEAVHTPPLGTRARIRGKVIRGLSKKLLKTDEVRIDWSSIGYDGYTLSMGDPLQSRSRRVEDFLARI